MKCNAISSIHILVYYDYINVCKICLDIMERDEFVQLKENTTKNGIN